jgi:beta-lactamase class A
MQELVKKLNELCDERPFETTWYLKDLRTGQEADRDGGKVVTSASTRKISIMMAVMNLVNEGKMSLDDPFEVEELYQKRAATQRGGCFQYFRPGFTVTLYDAVLMMIIVSDNTCTGKIVDLVGVDRLNDYCRSIGMEGTRHKHGSDLELDLNIDHPVEASNTTTARDVGMLLDLIVAGTSDPAAAKRLGGTPELCWVGMEILSRQLLRTKLPALLPPNGSVAHKTGTGLRHANDAGVVLANGEPRFILTVYTDGVPKQQRDGPRGQTTAALHIATLCRTCWDHLVA